MDVVKIGIRTLVEFVLRSGDIDSSFFDKNRMLEGADIHRKIQSAKSENYQSEYYLKIKIPHENTVFVLDGRADGVEIFDGKVIIDEIKSTATELDYIDENHNILHWAQAKCYGYIYCEQNDLDRIFVQLTYVYTETMETKVFIKEFTKSELKLFVEDLIAKYSVWSGLKKDHAEKRTKSLCELKFPFGSFRAGQRKMAASVYNTICKGKKLYATAPTGVGKTVSTLFPSLKAMGEGKCDKIFYLTAKELTRAVPEDCVKMMQKQGAAIKSVTITAKGKICFLDEPNCNPIDCKFAKGHFDRINDATLDLLQNEDFINKSVIVEYAEKYSVCPYELSLDISGWVDVVICDYNYLFDPHAKMKRYFYDQVQNPFVYLVDEAHNLVDRSREMYSAEIGKPIFLDAKKLFEKKSAIYKQSNAINKYFIELKKELVDSKFKVDEDEPSELIKLVVRWIDLCEKWLKNNRGHDKYKIVLDWYFDILAFLRIGELYGEEYCTTIKISGNNVFVKLFCLNPSRLLEECFATGIASVIFSATLTPLRYYFEVMGGCDDDFMISVDSPFDRENLCLISANHISTKYANREKSYNAIAEIIHVTVSRKKGNYLVYFPSYIYMNTVYEMFDEKYPDINTVVQKGGMSKAQQQDFVDSFSEDNSETLVGFSVLGGVFSEGIDLEGDKLYGTIVVGVGLPQVNVYQDVIKSYFDKTQGDGFSYAYIYPGFNKVMQAAGRVIRTETDKGIVLLIDERFAYRNYQKLFPKHWHHVKYISSKDELEKYLPD